MKTSIRIVVDRDFHGRRRLFVKWIEGCFVRTSHPMTTKKDALMELHKRTQAAIGNMV